MPPVNSETENKMTEQTPTPPAAPEQQARPTPQANNGTPAPAAGEKQPPWGDKPENFDADTAWRMIQNLRQERPDPEFRTEFQRFQAEQQQQRDALAAAFGVKPSEVSDTDKLAQQVSGLQSQILASERRALAAEHKVPEALLTATDADGMRTQALALVEFAQGAHHAAQTEQPPAFQPNPGQGQGNAPLSPEAQAAAEYEKYYPTASQR